MGHIGRSESTSPDAAGPMLRRLVESHVIEKHAPAHVVVDASGDVVYYSARTGRFLEPAVGSPSRQLATLARRGLRLELRTALREAGEKNQTIIRPDIEIEGDNNSILSTDLIVEPFTSENGTRLFLVLFTQRGPSRTRHEKMEREWTDHEADRVQLEAELAETRNRLQATIREYEASLEELKSSNEELLSVNEEVQSMNEELSASKEAMHSLNEELNTINRELSLKVDELDHAHSDLRNLFDSSRIATIFLDRDVVIRNFTPAAASLFNFRSADVGRPFTDLSGTLDYPELLEHVERVFLTDETIEQQLERPQSKTFYQVRLHPYRHSSGHTAGVVATFVDVTGLRGAEAYQRFLVSELNHRVKNMLSVVSGVVQQSLRQTADKDALEESLTGRLDAIAQTYALLSEDNWQKSDLARLISMVIEPFRSDQVQLDGPATKVGPDVGLAFGLILHELVTNAVKHGALSSAHGCLEVTWRTDGNRFKFDWKEKDGPEIAQAPEEYGFGLNLIKGEVEYRLGGNVQMDFDRGGLCLRLSFPLPELREIG
jgi:two-component system CheB/CheR fusion protein